MIFSRDRILTTHVGSLPRNETLSDLLVAQEEGKPYDPKVLADEMDKAVRHVVQASRWKPASTSAMTASSGASVSRPTCRSACRASPACRSAAAAASSRNSPSC